MRHNPPPYYTYSNSFDVVPGPRGDQVCIAPAAWAEGQTKVPVVIRLHDWGFFTACLRFIEGAGERRYFRVVLRPKHMRELARRLLQIADDLERRNRQ